MSNKKGKYISLHEATKHCDYSQEYLSLRARQGKLKAIKIGRNWVIEKEWLEDYLRRFNNNNGNNGEKEIKLLEPPSNLPVETFSNRFSISTYTEQSFFKLHFNSVAISIFILLLGGTILTGQLFFRETEFDYKKTSATLSILISKNNRASTVDVFKKYSEWLVDGFKSKAVKIRDFVFSPDEEKIIIVEKETKKEIKEPEQKNGVVMIPSSEKNEENEKKIKDAFSDDIKIEPEDESSGIITPVFKKREGQEYFYIMVPIEN